MADPDGDPTYRVIPATARPEELVITHDYYDHRDADRDYNIVFPLDRVRELVANRCLGGLTREHYSFMGHIDGRHVGTLQQEILPSLLQLLGSDPPDFVFLTPAWGICNRSVGLIQRAIEAAGIPTVSISILRDVTLKVRPPRALYLRWPFGHPLGEPGNIAQQFSVLHEAFQFLYSAAPGELRDLPYRWRRGTYSVPAGWARSPSDLSSNGEKE